MSSSPKLIHIVSIPDSRNGIDGDGCTLLDQFYIDNMVVHDKDGVDHIPASKLGIDCVLCNDFKTEWTREATWATPGWNSISVFFNGDGDVIENQLDGVRALSQLYPNAIFHSKAAYCDDNMRKAVADEYMKNGNIGETVFDEYVKNGAIITKMADIQGQYNVFEYDDNEEGVDVVQITHATKGDIEHSGEEYIDNTLITSTRVYNSLRDAIIGSGYFAPMLEFGKDFSAEERLATVSIVNELLKDEEYLSKYGPAAVEPWKDRTFKYQNIKHVKSEPVKDKEKSVDIPAPIDDSDIISNDNNTKEFGDD